jgi:hypothetical protein
MPVTGEGQLAVEVWILTTSYADYEGGGSEVHGAYSTKDLGMKAAIQYQNNEPYNLYWDTDEEVVWYKPDPNNSNESIELRRYVLDEVAE